MNRLKQLMNEAELTSSTISTCIARDTKQVIKAPHLLEFAEPPLVRLVTTDQGPNTSSPT